MTSEPTIAFLGLALPGWRDVADSGHADEDVAAVYTRTAA
jgi:hypothetical protein